ncbi:ATP-binding protein [Streptomyces sp. NPDC005805]|uniref:ATP-binding protein n=1 Tax=Streptomyces sp. NPDC005805 TaxID=3157068 RepID=UPI0033C79156
MSPFAPPVSTSGSTAAEGVALPLPQAPPEGPCRTLEQDYFLLPHELSSCGAARRRARALLEHAGIGDEAADAVLLVLSELVANAVEHAAPPVTVQLVLEMPGGAGGRRLRIRVRDGGCCGPLTPADDEGTEETDAGCVGGTASERGRGRAVVAALAADHGRHTSGSRAVTWAVVDCA